MPTTLELQGAVKLKKLAMLQLMRSMESRVLLNIFPMVKQNQWKLIYERREMNTGLQGARGLDGETNPVNKPGVDAYEVEPGVFGDHWTITERELVNLRDSGDWFNFDESQEQMARGTEHLTGRFLDRCEQSIAQILMTGAFTASDVAGVTKVSKAFNVPQFTPSTLFSDLNNSIPLTYIRDLIPTLELGVSVSFMKGFMLMSRPTANLILKNLNKADLEGRRLNYGQTVNNLDDLNDLLVSNDLPKIKVYDKTYRPDPVGSGPVRFLTNGKIILVGVRDDGEQVGEYQLCRAAHNGNNSPGEWYSVEDFRKTRHPKIILAAGHNGGPVVFYPEGLAVINAAAAF